MVFLWDFHWIPMGVLWYSYDVSMMFLWWFLWGVLLDSCRISIGLLWDFQGISMMFL